MVEVNLVSALAMGLVLLGIVVAVRVVRNWHAAPAAPGSGPTFGETLEDPTTWSVAFVAVALGAVLVVVAFLGGSIPGVSGDLAGLLVGAIFGLGLAFFLSAGVYATARNRGLPRSMAVAAGSTTLGALLLVAIVLKLVFGG